MKILRPDWLKYTIATFTDEKLPDKSYLDHWFDQNVKPVNKMLAEGKVMYLKRHKKHHYWSGNTINPEGCADKALLINIQPLECEHEPTIIREDHGIGIRSWHECKHCGKKLKAKWKLDE